MSKPLSPEELSAAAVSHDGAWLVTACFNGTFSCWDTSKGLLVKRWKDTPPRTGQISWSADGRHIAYLSLRSAQFGAYTITAVEAHSGKPKIIADLDPDDGARLGFDWSLDGGTLLFADTMERDHQIVPFLSKVPLPRDGGVADLGYGTNRERVDLPRGVSGESLFVTTTGYYFSACLIDNQGKSVWEDTAPCQHEMSPTRERILRIEQNQVWNHEMSSPEQKVQSPYELGNSCSWSQDGSRFCLNAAIDAQVAYAVFRSSDGTFEAAVRDGQPYRQRNIGELGLFLLENWTNVALNHDGSALVIADNEAGELRAWQIKPEVKQLWSCSLDDLSFVKWNGKSIVAASSTQILFVDGSNGQRINAVAVHD